LTKFSITQKMSVNMAHAYAMPSNDLGQVVHTRASVHQAV